MSKYYKILGLQPGASKLQIKKAYYQLSKKLHPDVNKAANAKEAFIEVSIAYEYLIKFGGKPIIKTTKPNYSKKKKAHTDWQNKAKKTTRKAARRSNQPRYVANTSMTAELVFKIQSVMTMILVIFFIFIIISFFIYAHYRQDNNLPKTMFWGKIIGFGIAFIFIYPVLLGIAYSLKPKKNN